MWREWWDYTGEYVEVLEFTHFVKVFMFMKDEQNHKNKVLPPSITVSVVLDLRCGTTNENVFEKLIES